MGKRIIKMNKNITNTQCPASQAGCDITIEHLKNGGAIIHIPLVLFGKVGLKKIQNEARKAGMSIEEFLYHTIMLKAEKQGKVLDRRELCCAAAH